MRKSILVLVLIMAFTVGSGLSTALDTKQNNTNANSNQDLSQGPLSKIIINDEKDYQNFSKLALIQFSEDMAYSSKILKNYVKKNITRDEALLSTVAIYTLTSKTVNLFQSVEPPKDYQALHNYVLVALINLDEYLFYLSKYYETDEGLYYNQAKANFNLSADYYNKSLKESSFFF